MTVAVAGPSTSTLSSPSLATTRGADARKLAPLTVEPDLRIVTDLLRMAAKVDTEDPAEVQELADASYKAKKASENVSDWVKSTCAVDLATGLSIEPPRTVPTTTTTVAAPAPTAAP